MSRFSKMQIVIASVAVLATGFVVYLLLSSSKVPENVSEATDEELSVRINLDNSKYLIGETIKFKSFIQNISGTDKAYTFNNTCTDGTLYIDDQPIQLIRACGQALTKIGISPGETISYDYSFVLVDSFSADVKADDYIDFDDELRLQPGQHEAVLRWQGFESNPLSFDIE